MIKVMLMAGLLLAIPTGSDTAKAPTKQEIIQLRTTVKNLEELTAELQDRLQANKVESDSLKKRLSTLESRVADLENTVRPVSTGQ